ncbi:unnamed protein product [Acanthoscelides obtectus]|uniref:non-specific serine/threonine protein kinase n=1 Tax=Acanthoscelides obtectus TaxID=200917 RepID=A0A9P0P0Z7_ACAOB|nr:unnamed protein product [Acanthoscelides obtectus]CAK1628755.1 Eukaryotic translation initiation factor 2-alpha kinase 3 [Acanthoscelides obtectus]
MFKIVLALLSLVFGISFGNGIPSLPYCSEKTGSGLLLVSTLDGRMSALNITGDIVWQIQTGPGPLLHSNIHNLELTNNGEWIRIIPSLSGTLYKFDGTTVDPIFISTENLLKSSFRFSDDLVIAGGIEVRTYGLGLRTGSLYYECTSVSCSNTVEQDVDDVLLVERSTHVVRAIEPRTGSERWNFSVGLHDVKLHIVSCIDNQVRLYDWNLTAIVPKGLLRVVISQENVTKHSWQHTFTSPIVRIWKWTGSNLTEVNLFTNQGVPKVITDTPLLPSIYLGMHDEQLYILESSKMHEALYDKSMKMVASPPIVETSSIMKIRWNAIPASTEVTEDDSTALSVLNGSKYVNGHGFYLYSEPDAKPDQKYKNESCIRDAINGASYDNLSLIFLSWWWKEFFVMALSIFICNFLFHIWNNTQKKQEIIIIEKPGDAQNTVEKSNEGDTFTSRYVNDFDTVRCLGKGGFGVVFEVKKKIDECNYAIKRITLPKEPKKRDRVMREVKALAKLEHQNIVRYFSSWVEKPPVGWQEEHDKKWIMEKHLEETSTSPKTRRSKSVSINIPLSDDAAYIESDSDDDGFQIVFQDDSNSKSHLKSSVNKKIEDNLTMTLDSGLTEHTSKKVNWKRPGRMHHSWDLSQNQLRPSEESSWYLYIQMQLCKKESLKEWLTSNYKRDYKFVIDIFSQILDAVQYIHLRGLIHRDLKPSNIFFSLEGQIKVGDFGLVKDMEDVFDLEFNKNGTPPLPGHTKEVGTQLYMSPEQFRSRIYDYKVDIYSLGLIFLELLIPFSTEMERVKKLTDAKENKYPSDFIEKFADEHTLLQSMLCKDPNKRLTTIGIRTRPPFNQQDSTYDEDCHYKLNNFQKS